MRSKLSSRSESSVRTRGCTHLERHVPAYREYLLGRGNVAGYVRSCEAAVMHFSMWMHQTTRVRQLRAQVLVFARSHFQKCHYNSANCSGAAGFSIPKA